MRGGSDASNGRLFCIGFTVVLKSVVQKVRALGVQFSWVVDPNFDDNIAVGGEPWYPLI
jgi:hypothetical protein